MSTQRWVATGAGEARVVSHRARRTLARLVLTHGAGGGIDAADLAVLAERLPAHGIAVTLVEMPWRVAGKKLAPRPEVIDRTYLEVLAALRGRGPLVLGGRSAGARSACRIAGEAGAEGVLALAFPLHPPGRPERSRVEELEACPVPVLIVQGGRDPFGTPEEFPEDHELAVVPEADHALRVPKRAALDQPEALAIIVEAALEWMVRDIVGAESAPAGRE